MELVVIANNIRSTHNVGSILRTADGFGVHKVFLTGYTPYPAQEHDARLPHLRVKLTAQIHKTALGAEITVPTEHVENIGNLLRELKDSGYELIALEQHERSTPLNSFVSEGKKLALLLGEEVNGIPPDLLALCDHIIEIPMRGQKESFNVSVAAGISIYELSKHTF